MRRLRGCIPGTTIRLRRGSCAQISGFGVIFFRPFGDLGSHLPCRRSEFAIPCFIWRRIVWFYPLVGQKGGVVVYLTKMWLQVFTAILRMLYSELIPMLRRTSVIHTM